MMKKLFPILLLLLSPLAYGQNNTTVTSTVKDSNSTAYIFGTFTVSLVNNSGQQASFGGNPNFQQTYSGSLNASGVLSISLPSVTVMFPSGMQWQFFICANPKQYAAVFPQPTNPICFNYTSTGTQISGASVDLSSSMASVVTVVPLVGVGGGGGGASSVGGVQTIYAASAPYNIVADGGRVYDGVITHNTTDLSSATAHWQTNAKVGQRIWGVDNTNTLAFMGTIQAIVSDTHVTVSQTSACSSANPCTSLHVGWGTGNQNTAFQSFMGAIANSNSSKPTCGIFPSGAFVWEAAFANSGIQDKTCILSAGHTVFLPSPDFAFTAGGQISFANANTGINFRETDIEIDGMGLINGDGRTTVFNGVSNSEALFIGEGTYYNITINSWGDTVTGWQCVKIDNYTWAYNLQCLNSGLSQVQGGGPLNPAHIIGGNFQSQNSGGPTLICNTDCNTEMVNWGPNGGTNHAWEVNVAGTSNWHSSNDTFSPASASASILCSATSGTEYIDNATISNAGQAFDVITVQNGCVVHISRSKITANSGQYFCNSHSSSGTCFDDGGNTFVTGTNGDFVNSNSINGTACATGNWALTSGWGTSSIASVTAGGDSHRCQVVITGAAGSAGPVLTWTFPKAYLVGTPQLPGSCQITFNGTLTGSSTGAPTATSVAFTFTGTPSAQTYRLDASCGP